MRLGVGVGGVVGAEQDRLRIVIRRRRAYEHVADQHGVRVRRRRVHALDQIDLVVAGVLDVVADDLDVACAQLDVLAAVANRGCGCRAIGPHRLADTSYGSGRRSHRSRRCHCCRSSITGGAIGLRAVLVVVDRHVGERDVMRPGRESESRAVVAARSPRASSSRCETSPVARVRPLEDRARNGAAAADILPRRVEHRSRPRYTAHHDRRLGGSRRGELTDVGIRARRRPRRHRRVAT